jgi:hypothetical protein
LNVFDVRLKDTPELLARAGIRVKEETPFLNEEEPLPEGGGALLNEQIHSLNGERHPVDREESPLNEEQRSLQCGAGAPE